MRDRREDVGPGVIDFVYATLGLDDAWSVREPSLRRASSAVKPRREAWSSASSASTGPCGTVTAGDASAMRPVGPPALFTLTFAGHSEPRMTYEW